MIRTRIHTPATPDEIFGVLGDGERYADWVVGAKRIRRADADFPRPGSTIDHTLGIGPLVIKDCVHSVRAERPRLLELDAHGWGLRAAVRFELFGDSSGTTIVMEEVGTNLLSRALTKLLRPAMLGRNAETMWRLHVQVRRGAVGEEQARRDAGASTLNSELPRWLGDLTARTFGIGAALRRERALHPKGVTFAATARLNGWGEALSDRPILEAIVRFSRGAGLPARLPDVNGVAIRLVDACGPHRHRDLLFASSGDGRLRQVIVPAIGFGGTPFSSIVRYGVDDMPAVLRAEVRPPGLTFDELRREMATDRGIEISVWAEGDDRRRKEMAVVSLGERVDGSAIRFDPTGADPRLQPIGLIAALREPAYMASQAVRTNDLDKASTRSGGS